ncbi:MAG: hypothetical protein IIY04_05250 [Oscillospiraceae bacterium]|nr:hypothetical protein [Oscillospiraceae bacterium]
MREIMGFECKHFPIKDGQPYAYGCFSAGKENAPHHGGCEAAVVFPLSSTIHFQKNRLMVNIDREAVCCTPEILVALPV